jgi:SAM-dependent methyltransferase
MTATAPLPSAPRCPICGGTVFGPGPKGRTSPNGAMPRCAGCQSFASHELSVYGEPGGLDIQAIDRPDAAYDIAICSHVLEHVGDDRAALHELLRIVKPDGLLYLAFPDPFREEVTRDWGFPKPEKHGHWRVYGADVVKRFAANIPRQSVLAYRGQDPATGEWEGAFLLPRSAARHRWIVEKLGGSASLFSGPGL